MFEAQDVNQESKSGRIGFFVADPLVAIYREIAGLLGVSYRAVGEAVLGKDALTDNLEFLNYDAIIVDGISLSYLKGLMLNFSRQDKDKPLILVCGPVTGDSLGFRLKTFPFQLGLEGARLLMEGREHTEVGVSEPILDLMLEEIREVLRHEVTNYLELPAAPWGYAYALTLTHDIDVLSLKEMPIARTFLGYFYRSSVLNWKRWRAEKVHSSEYFRAIWEMARTWLAKVGIGQDVWQRALPTLIALEERLEVRSSLYFMPYPENPGIFPERMRKNNDQDNETDSSNNKDKNNDKNKDKDRKNDTVRAPANRASHYDVNTYKELLNHLEEGGWEAGVHGIDAWHDLPAARAEYDRIANLTEQKDIGVRMHWLYFKSPQSYKLLEDGGFQYDATVGFNEVVGFRAGTLQPYHPLNCQTLWELPLHIQDGALLGEEHLDLNREDAFHKAKPILDYALRFGGAVSLLWHNQSFTAPRFWGEVYERLIAQARIDSAWIAVPRDVLRWFTLRRACEVSLSIDGTQWQISCAIPDQDRGSRRDARGSNRQDQDEKLRPSIPPVRVRLHLEPNRIVSASVPYEVGEGYIDFPAQALVTLDVKGED
ncbi:MAG: hypothetical protein APF81_00825 [Desulfosporosinus sp. BRH_c37]|nr:MAG: hypothetical protein APF81_00825 [Desulfosporosinus sp. BRH_c37]